MNNIYHPPGEMYFGTGGDIPKQLEDARQAARKSRMEANDTTCCPTCEPLSIVAT